MLDTNQSFQKLQETIKELRGENGCPWDKRQTTASLVTYLHAEFNELMEGIANNDPENICEELGDLLYLIIMIAEIHEKINAFTMHKVIHTVTEKLIRRHPHVFAGATVLNEDELTEQWQAIKALEKSGKSV
jgi:tetrapyrrole methylase family protein / MazG family protein